MRQQMTLVKRKGTMMANMVDRVADALGNHLHGDDQALHDAARAAIKAMREPTSKMIRIADEYDDSRCIQGYQALIDAALSS
jgi:hypothetical protein